MSTLSDVFTVDEIAHAAGVPRDAVRALIASGTVRPLTGTAFFGVDEAIRAGKEARRSLGARGLPPTSVVAGLFTSGNERTAFATQRRGLPAFASSLAHAVFIVTMLWLTSGRPQTAPAPTVEPRLVFLSRPGPGGGGGGGGLRNPLPPPQVETPKAVRRSKPVPDTSPDKILVSSRRVEVPRPKPTIAPTRPPRIEDPLPSRTLIAPVAVSASARRRDGAIEQSRTVPDSLGAGTEGGVGTGRGLGDGEGIGSGIGPGADGGIGGGPYRAGSGIDPPRLIREVKAQYTEDARRRGTTGDVILEIVVNRDGTVGNVSVTRGLGGGLDQRAIDAVRQWRFTPARRHGEAVDVIVEVAVEFKLR